VVVQKVEDPVQVVVQKVVEALEVLPYQVVVLKLDLALEAQLEAQMEQLALHNFVVHLVLLASGALEVLKLDLALGVLFQPSRLISIAPYEPLTPASYSQVRLFYR